MGGVNGQTFEKKRKRTFIIQTQFKILYFLLKYEGVGIFDCFCFFGIVEGPLSVSFMVLCKSNTNDKCSDVSI